MAQDLLEARVLATGRRIRLRRAIEAAVLAAVPGLALLGFGMLRAWLRETVLDATWIASATLLPLAAASLAALRTVSPLAMASLLDRAHALPDSLSSAWAFGRLPASEQSPFMRATYEQALTLAPTLSARQAAPFERPRHAVALLLVALGVACLSQLATRTRVSNPVIATVPVPLLDEDDAAAFRADVKEVLAHGAAPDAVRQAADELNTLLRELADGKVDASEALAKLHALEAQLAEEQARAAREREALRELGRGLAASRATRELGTALAEQDMERAKREAQKLAEQARSRPDREHSQAQADKRANELRDALREHKKRELDKLDREPPNARAERQRRQRQLDRLERNLNDAADNMERDQRDAAGESLDQAAENLGRMQQAQSGEARDQARSLAERTREVRELLRRQGSARSQQRMASGDTRGQQAQASQPSQQDQQSGMSGSAPQPRAGGQAQADAIARARAMAQRGGAGDAQPQPLTLEDFRAGARGQSPRGQSGGNASANDTAARARDDSSGSPGGGPPVSDPHAPTPGAVASGSDVHVAGDHGRGPTRSQIIYEAASRGFAARPYTDVHADYARHAESELERDEIPAGYRFYVRRYFQMIRPREDAHE